MTVPASRHRPSSYTAILSPPIGLGDAISVLEIVDVDVGPCAEEE
jgi:hypothetical protein